MEQVKEMVACPPSADRPYIRDDNEQLLDTHISVIATDIANDGVIAQAVRGLFSSLN